MKKLLLLSECVVPENIHPPPHGRSLEIPRGREFKGSGGFMGSSFSRG